MTPQDFIAKWGAPDGVPGPSFALNEEQGAQSHFLDLCELLGVPKPGSAEGYRFEEKSQVIGGKTGYADVVLRGSFAWENKAPGKNLDSALKQLLTYSLALANPPILVVSDRLTIRVHTQFTGHPSETHTVGLYELDQPEKLALLRRIWTAPHSFKPRQTSRDITEAAAQSFAKLADSLRQRGSAQGIAPEQVSHFLTQCVFSLFAEDVGLLPGRMFERLLANKQAIPERLVLGLTQLFETMRSGTSPGSTAACSKPWPCPHCLPLTCSPCAKPPHSTGAPSTPASSAPCSSAGLTPPNAANWARTTPTPPPSSASLAPSSDSH